MAKVLASIAAAPDFDDNDRFCYWTFRDLQARRIVATRTDLHRKQRFYGFPKPVILTGGGQGAAALYRVSEVKTWVMERERLGTSNRAPGPQEGSRPRGRPRKEDHAISATR